VTLERWTAFVGVLLVVVFTPGPDFAVVFHDPALAPGTRRPPLDHPTRPTRKTRHPGAAVLGFSRRLAG
jgi:hypothetical protein